MYKCEILADSLSPQGHRLTTFKITYPRIIHAEMLRHRMLSRNTASSRAIPFKKMVKDVEENPFIPIAWQKDHKGMQGTEYITDKYNLKTCIEDWLEARDNAIKSAIDLSKGFNKKDEEGNWITTDPEEFVDGVTKQLCNRLLEPFVWTTELITGTEWENFFDLRCPKYEYNCELYRSKKDLINSYTFDKGFEKELEHINSLSNIEWLEINKSQADIHIQAIAELMWDAYNESTPLQLEAGEWHIPNFGHEWDDLKLEDLVESYSRQRGEYRDEIKTNFKLQISTAHCARISYTTLGDNPKIDYGADIKLHDRLLVEGHMSPMEHCSVCKNDNVWYANFKGWQSYRNVLGF